MQLSEARQHANSTEGWLSEQEGAELYQLAAQNNKGWTVEIGSWKGKSTIYLAAGAQENQYGNNHIVAIDHFHGSPEHNQNGPVYTLPEFWANLERAGVIGNVSTFIMPSARAAESWGAEPVGLLFIDGNHEYEAVKADLDMWWPKIAPEGILAMHDLNWDGPARIIREELLGRPDRTIEWKCVDTLFIAKKVG
jgi:predicted O-methyltransferase YrrM